MSTIRISPHSHKKLKELAKIYGVSMQVALDQAIDTLERDQFFKQADQDYARLKSNPIAWKEELEERKLWESTLLDGLTNDEW